MKTLINKSNPEIRITAPEIEIGTTAQYGRYFRVPCLDGIFWERYWTLVEEEPTEGIRGEKEEIPSNIDIKKELYAYMCSDEYISTREDGSLLIARHFYELKLKARKEE